MKVLFQQMAVEPLFEQFDQPEPDKQKDNTNQQFGTNTQNPIVGFVIEFIPIHSSNISTMTEKDRALVIERMRLADAIYAHKK